MIRCLLIIAAGLAAMAATTPPKFNVRERPVRIDFPGLGRLTVTPLVSTYAARCALRIQSARGTAQIVPTFGAPGRSGVRCGGITAVGRVPAPAGRYRIAVIHIGNEGAEAYYDASAIVPVVITRSTADPRWQVDAKLAQALEDDGATETIAEIRAHIALFKD